MRHIRKGLRKSDCKPFNMFLPNTVLKKFKIESKIGKLRRRNAWFND